MYLCSCMSAKECIHMIMYVHRTVIFICKWIVVAYNWEHYHSCYSLQFINIFSMKWSSSLQMNVYYCTVCSTNKIQLSSNEEKQLFVDDFYTIHTIQYSHLRMKCIQFHTLESMKLSANELKLMKLINKKMQLSLIN